MTPKFVVTSFKQTYYIDVSSNDDLISYPTLREELKNIFTLNKTTGN